MYLSFYILLAKKNMPMGSYFGPLLINYTHKIVGFKDMFCRLLKLSEHLISESVLFESVDFDIFILVQMEERCSYIGPILCYLQSQVVSACNVLG